MNVGTVILLPAAELPAKPLEPWGERLEIAAGLVGYNVPTYVVGSPEPADSGLDLKTATAHWVAHIAIELTQAQPLKPILLVAHGSAGTLLPAIGFAQKASRRPVAGYVVIDGELPKSGAADWPDAPISYIQTAVATSSSQQDADSPSLNVVGQDQQDQDPARVAELRGWSVYRDADPVDVLNELYRN